MNPILSLRQQAGLTQIDAAALAGMDQPRWSEVERRPTLRDTPYGTLERVARALGVEVAELVEPQEAKP